jgi:hypothetical protein
MEDANYILIEQDEEYVQISTQRCQWWSDKFFNENRKEPTLF